MSAERDFAHAQRLLGIKERLDRDQSPILEEWQDFVAGHAKRLRDVLSIAARRLDEVGEIPQRVATHEDGTPNIEKYIPLTHCLAGQLPGFVLRNDGKLFVLSTWTDASNKAYVDWTGEIREATDEEVVQYRESLLVGLDLFLYDRVPANVRLQVWDH